jgi:phospholipase/carboxylesterase
MKVDFFAHRWVAGKSLDTLLLLHGTGGNDHDLLPLGRALDPNANLLSPRGKILENGMPRFFRRLAEGVFDEQDLRNRTGELAQWIAEASLEYGFDAKARTTAVGYSNGANIAASLLLAGKATFERAILLRAMVPFEPGSGELPDLKGKRILMLSGTQDRIIPPPNSERLAELLQQAGAEVTLRWSETGHGLEQHEIDEAREWLVAVPTAAKL